MRGDRLTYYPDDDEVLGVGAVQMARDGNVFTGPELRLKIDANEGFLASPEYLLGRFNGRGRARHAEFLGPDQFRLDDTSYTTCQASDPDWYLHIDQLTVDETLQEGRAVWRRDTSTGTVRGAACVEWHLFWRSRIGNPRSRRSLARTDCTISGDNPANFRNDVSDELPRGLDAPRCQRSPLG